ncbi:MAG: hypothetical protein IJF56_08325 [Clostridia bacterium]|nr:hypothetical protein [Clostridia bacterium]
MIELIVSLLIVAGGIFGYFKSKSNFEDRALRMISCLGCAVAAVLAGLYALLTAIMLLPF